MSDRRRSLLILLLVFGLIAASAVVVATKETKLGLDLQGGVQLVYEGQPTPQQPTVDQQALAQSLGLPIEKTRIDVLLAGGSFGRRAQPTSHLAAELGEVAKALNGTPLARSRSSAASVLASCISASVPSCMRAPPDALTTISGTRAARA